MESGKARELFERYSAAMAYVAVQMPDGSESIGSAFHVGEGVFVTARHVVEGKTILQVATTEIAYVPLTGQAAETAKTFVVRGDTPEPIHRVQPADLRITAGPHCHSDSRVDVAAFQVQNIDDFTPVAQLGTHLDDWMGASDFVLTEAIVLGYPPIPMTREPALVAARAEVNARIDRRDVPHVHFVISSMPRGGFSGGLVLSEFGYVLGLVTQSLTGDGGLAELGFMSVLGVEPIYQCLDEGKLLPQQQSDVWDGLDCRDTVTFCESGSDPHRGGQTAAWVEIMNFDTTHDLSIFCRNDVMRMEAARRAEDVLGASRFHRTEERQRVVRLEVSDGETDVPTKLAQAAQAAMEVLEGAGLARVRKSQR